MDVRQVAGALCALTMGGSVAYSAQAGPFSHIGIGGYGAYMQVDGARAEREGVDDEGYIIGVEVASELLTYFTLNGGIGLAFMDDEDPFEQTVVEKRAFSDDKTFEEESDIEGLSLFLEGGVQLPVGFEDKLNVGMNLGYHFLDLERTISNCADCREEDVDIDAGLYVQPHIAMRVGAIQGNLAYNYFIDQDAVESMWQLSVRWMFDIGSR